MNVMIPAGEMRKVFREKLDRHGVHDAALLEECADIMVQNSLNGVYSHGVNRFQRLISYIDKGYINPDARPSMVKSFGSFEQWDGNLGLGATNAHFCMERAIALAKKAGIGCVALRNTNHWMRGGEYGLQAAEAGCVGICWSNTMPNMPAWGAKDCRIGNNPFILCVPRKGAHIMVDGAMSQFSYGAVEKARLEGEDLPVYGGYDTNGTLTKNPAAIEQSGRFLPMGYWKGSAMSIMLDMIVTILSDGNSVYRVGRDFEEESGLSQIFIAINAEDASARTEELIQEIIRNVEESEPAEEGQRARVPNARSNRCRQENLENGIPVNESVWQTILNL